MALIRILQDFYGQAQTGERENDDSRRGTSEYDDDV